MTQLRSQGEFVNGFPTYGGTCPVCWIDLSASPQLRGLSGSTVGPWEGHWNQTYVRYTRVICKAAGFQPVGPCWSPVGIGTSGPNESPSGWWLPIAEAATNRCGSS